MNWKLAFFIYVGLDIALCIKLYTYRLNQLRKTQKMIARMNHPTYKTEWTNKDTENSKYPYNQETDDEFLKIIDKYNKS